MPRRGHQLEDRLRADDAVVVLELVGHLQAVRRRLRLAGERDGRRTVGNGGELPGQIARSAHRGGAVAVDDEAPLGGAAVGRRLCRRFRLGEPAGGGDVEIDLAAGADDQHAAGRHRDRPARGLHRLARPQALQDQRRLRGVGRRADPGVDAEIRRRDRALPVESRLHALACGRRRRRRTSRSPSSAPARAAPSDRAPRRAASALRPAASWPSAARARYARARARRHDRHRSRRRSCRRSWWRADASVRNCGRDGAASRSGSASAGAAAAAARPRRSGRTRRDRWRGRPAAATATARARTAPGTARKRSRSTRAPATAAPTGCVQRARLSARSSIAWPPSAGRGSIFGTVPEPSVKSNSSNENLRECSSYHALGPPARGKRKAVTDQNNGIDLKFR